MTIETRDISAGVVFTDGNQPAAAPTTDTPPPAPAANAPALKIPTVEELRERTVEMYASMGWGKPSKEVLDGIQAEEQPQSPPAANAPAAAAPAAELEVEAEPEPEPEPELTTSEIISRTASETARAVAEAVRPQQAQAPAPAPEPEMSPEDKDDQDTLRYLETTDAKYQGMASKHADFVRKNYAYVNAWMKENPGKEFDQEDTEHSQFYADNMPDVDPSILERARIEMIADRKAEERYQKRIAPQERARRQGEAFEQNRVAIAQAIDRREIQLIQKVAPELAKSILNDKGQAELTKESIERMKAEDPMAFEILNEICAKELEPCIVELRKANIREMEYTLEPQNNPVHARIGQFLERKESQLASLPPSKSMQGGKHWLPVGKYDENRAAIARGPGSAEQKQAAMSQFDSRFWCLTPDVIEDLMVDYYSHVAKAEIARTDNLARRKYGIQAPAAPATAAQPASSVPSAPASRPHPNANYGGNKPISPSLGGQADVVTTQRGASSGQKTFGEEATDVAFSR